MLDDTDTDPQTDPNANWVPPWATQPAASTAPSDTPAVPPEPVPALDPSVTPQTGADLANVLTGGPQAPGGGPDQTAAANPPPVEIQMPDDYVGAPYAGSSGVPAAAPFADNTQPANLQAPPLQAPTGAPGLQNLGQPAPIPAPTPAVHDNRLAGLLPVDQMHALGLATDKTVDPSVRAAAWNALPANIRTETMLHAQGDQLDTLGGIYEHLSPQEQVAWQVANGNSEQMRTNTAIAKATTDYQSSIDKNHQWELQQRQRISAQMDANNARAQQLANEHVGVQFSPLSKVGVVLGSMLGGMAGTNGSNAFMDSLNKNIDRQVAEQKYNLENKWKGLNESNNVLGQEWARTGDMAQAEYTYRQAAYGATLNTIKTEAQNYIPGGTTHAKLQATYDATVSQMQQAAQLHQQQQEEAVAKIAKARGDALESVAKGRIEAIKGGIKPEAFLDKSWLNPMGGGGPASATGGAYSPKTKYTYDQFQQLHPGAQMPDRTLFGKSGAFEKGISEADWGEWSKSDATNNPTSVGMLNPITGQPLELLPEAKAGGVRLKDEDRKDIKTQLNGYAEAQNAWAELDAVGARIQYRRSLGGQIAKRFAATDEREYEAKRKALITKMTKQLGERPNETSIKTLGDMVPELASMGTEADIGKMIHDAQSSNDREFATQLNTSGVDGGSVIKGAQAMRKPPVVPSTVDQVTAANEALMNAKSPSEIKDATEAVDQAKTRAAAEVTAERQKDAAMGAAAGFTPLQLAGEDQPGVPSEHVALIKQVNDAADTYNQLLRQFHDAWTAKKPDVAKARALALKVVNAKETWSQLAGSREYTHPPEGIRLEPRF